MFKVGDMVAVCYDGKISRAVQGKVDFISPKGSKLSVKFIPWANEEVGFIFGSFRLEKKLGTVCSTGQPFQYYFGSIIGKGESGIQAFISGYSGDYYTVLSESIVIEEGYSIEPYNRGVVIDYND